MLMNFVHMLMFFVLVLMNFFYTINNLLIKKSIRYQYRPFWYRVSTILKTKYRVSVSAILVSSIDDTQKQSNGIGIGHHGIVPSLVFNNLFL